MEAAFRGNRYEGGVLAAIDEITALLAQHFPPRGDKGFGYDPIFRPDELEKTFGEMMSAEKHALPGDGSRALSHRARAFQALAKACLTP